MTLITYSRSLKTTLAAAEQLADEGIDAEVIDLRTIRPLDLDTLLASVVKTHRAVIVEEDWPYCGLGAGIADRITQRAFDELDAPIRRVAAKDAPDPVQPEPRSLDAPERRPDRGARSTTSSIAEPTRAESRDGPPAAVRHPSVTGPSAGRRSTTGETLPCRSK